VNFFVNLVIFAEKPVAALRARTFQCTMQLTTARFRHQSTSGT